MHVSSLQGKHGIAILAYSVAIPVSVARCSSANLKKGGNSLPRFSARRRIPRAAFGLKKYLRGTSVSKMSDNEHTAAALGHSEILSVKNPPAHAIPEFDQPSKDGGKVPSPVAG